MPQLGRALTPLEAKSGKYKKNQVIRSGNGLYLRPGIEQQQYQLPPIQPQQPDTSQQDLVARLTELLMPKTAPIPDYDPTGAERSDINAMVDADYTPQFGIQNQRLQQSQLGATRGLGQQQAQDTGNQLSNYYNRGLSRSGALVGAQNYLQGNQAYDTQNLQRQQTYDTGELGQTQQATLKSVKNTAYTDAFNNYLKRFKTQ